MRAVGIKLLKNKLSEYVRAAERGETILVTDRDRVIAELGPARPGRSPWVADAQLVELLRQGILTPPLRRAGRPPRSRPSMTLEELLRELAADRQDRL